MSYIQLDGSIVDFPDAQYDAFGRLRISESLTIFDAKFTYGTEEGLYFSDISGTASATFSGNEGSWILSVGTTGGDKIIRETYRSFLYIPGKSHLINMTGTLGSPKVNVRQQIGYFDDKDGVYFEQTSFGISVNLKSSTAGSVVIDSISQANWNRDKLDGTGESGYTLDTTKAQIFIIDLQWLGVGRVRYGVDLGGKIIYCHEINNANIVNTAYMRTAQLPMRYVLENTGITASSTEMRQICSTVISEGGYSPTGPMYTFYSGNTPVELPANTDVIIATYRLRPTIGGNPNRSVADFLSMDIVPTSNRAIHYYFVVNATLTGDNFQPSGAQSSVVDIDTSAVSYVGGESRHGGLLTGPRTLDKNTVNMTMIPGATFSIVMRALSIPTSAWVVINWNEIT